MEKLFEQKKLVKWKNWLNRKNWLNGKNGQTEKFERGYNPETPYNFSYYIN